MELTTRNYALQFKRSNHVEALTRARITLLDDPAQSAHEVEVKNLDERGITFHHQAPLNDRRAMVVLEGPQLGRFVAEVDLTWCRFNRTGRYTSGGRFVQPLGKTA